MILDRCIFLASFWFNETRCCAAGISIGVMYLCIKYQQALHIKYAAWITVVACALMLGLAIDGGVQSRFPDAYDPRHLFIRSVVMGAWITSQILLILVGVIMKVLIPCASLFCISSCYNAES